MFYNYDFRGFKIPKNPQVLVILLSNKFKPVLMDICTKFDDKNLFVFRPDKFGRNGF